MSSRVADRRRRCIVWIVVTLLAVPNAAFAQGPVLPQGGQVVQGSAAVATTGPGQMTVTQTSNRAIVNWQDFSIGAGGVVNILQPDAASALLNRVTGNNLSAIDGRLQANGQVYLLNPHGIVVGPNGVIDTAGFLGSILHTSDAGFMAGGTLSFHGDAIAGIVNLGTIRAATGDVTLLAPAIVNRGAMTAPNGTAALVSGREIVLAPGGPGSFLIKTSLAAPGDATIDNSGVIAAAQAELRAAGSPYALAIRNSGLVSATSLTRSGGRVVLDGGAGRVVNSGSLTAQSGDRGGAIDVTGARVELTGSARLDASGAAGGGTIRVGGGLHGADASIGNAVTTDVEAGATLRADATASGDGGSVVVWSDEATSFAGRIDARGAATGNGGSAEVSGRALVYSGLADLTAPAGRTGTLLLDPATIDIDAALAATIVANLAGADVTEQATSSVTVSSAISNATTVHELKLDAPTIAINAGVSLPNGSLQLTSATLPAVSITSAASAALNASQISLFGSHPTIALSGPVTTPLLVVDKGGTVGNISVTSGSNAINKVDFVATDNNFASGDIVISSHSAMQAIGTSLTTGGTIALVATGNLTVSVQLNSPVKTTVASTTGAFINSAGLNLFGGTGRKLIYSKTDGGGFNAGGLGYTQLHGVSYPDDPQGSGNVIYFDDYFALPGMTITADAAQKVYGSPDPTFTASFSGGTAGDLTQGVQFSVTGAHVNVGEYSIVPFGAASNTRALTFVPGTLTITPAPLFIAVNNATTTYGNLLPAFTTTYTGLVNGDTPSVVSGLTVQTAATAASPVGTYTLTPVSASAANYSITYGSGQLRINPASLTIVGLNAQRLYGATNPALSFAIGGLVNGDSPSVVSGLTVSTPATERSGVGVYPITVSGGSASNYTIQYVDGGLRVLPAPLLVTTSSGSTIYGQAAPILTNTYSGLVAGDTAASLGLFYGSEVRPGTPVGSYKTVLGGALTNYAVDYRPGTITVTPAPLKIVADNFLRMQYQPNPQLTATVTGLVGNDTVADLTLTTAAQFYSASGTYAIVPSSGAMPNYDVTYVNGTLKVQAEPPVVTTLDGTVPGQDVLEQQMKNSFTNLNTNTVAVVNSFFGTDPLLVTAQRKLVDRYVETLALAGTTVTTADILAALSNPDTRDQMMGVLLPFLQAEVRDILKLAESARTPEQKALLAAVMNYIHAQRSAAADAAQEGYADWKQEQIRHLQETTTLSGNAGVIASAIEAANPEGPPDEFILRAEAGMLLTNRQTLSYARMLATLGGLANAGKDESGGTASPFGAMPLAVAGAGRVISMIASSGPDSVKLVEAVPELGEIFKGGKYFSGERFQKVLKVIDRLGPTTKELTKTTEVLEVFEQIGDSTQYISKTTGKRIYAEFDPSKLPKSYSVNEEGKIVQSVTQEGKVIEEGVKTGSKISRVLEVAGEVLGTAGVILEVVGNAVQIGVGVAGYATIGDYERRLDQTSATLRKPVTEASLNRMSDLDLMAYLGTMMTTRGQVVGQ